MYLVICGSSALQFDSEADLRSYWYDVGQHLEDAKIIDFVTDSEREFAEAVGF